MLRFVEGTPKLLLGGPGTYKPNPAGTQVPTLEGDDVGRSSASCQAPPEAHDPELGPLEALPDLGRLLPAMNHAWRPDPLNMGVLEGTTRGCTCGGQGM